MSEIATTAGWWNWEIVRGIARAAGALHRGLYRASRGKLGGSIRGVPVGLLTTRGSKSGRMYTWPICYLEEDDNFILIASSGGSPRNPAWYFNLRANPNVTIQVGAKAREMVAEPQVGPRREGYWKRVVQQYPLFADYQRKVTREIPVIFLSPVTREQ